MIRYDMPWISVKLSHRFLAYMVINIRKRVVHHGCGLFLIGFQSLIGVFHTLPFRCKVNKFISFSCANALKTSLIRYE